MENINKIWPKWEPVEVLGEGGFGKVYKAKRSDIEAYSAIKVIKIPNNQSEVKEMTSSGLTNEHLKSYYYKSVTAFTDEIKLMIKLKSAGHIVGIEDYEVVENKDSFGWTIYIRMELLTNLSDYLKGKVVTVDEVKKMALHILNALEYCHDLNIIHRDIKPANIFVSEFGDYKLGDFGVSKEVEKTNATLSQKGTKSYMAPEMVRMEHYSKNVDMYALGLTMYELLNHNRMPFLPPYPETYFPNDREEAIFKRLAGQEFPPIEGIGKMNDIIFKACHPQANMRYETATEMKKALLDLGETSATTFEEVVEEEKEIISFDDKTYGDNSEKTIGNFNNPFVNKDEKTMGMFGGTIFDEIEKKKETAKLDSQKIVNYIIQTFKQNEGIDLQKDMLAMGRITKEADRAAKALESASTYDLSIPYIAANASGALHIEMTIDHSVFDEQKESQKKSQQTFLFEDNVELEPLQRVCPYCGKKSYLQFSHGYYCPSCDKINTTQNDATTAKLSDLSYRYLHSKDNNERLNLARSMMDLDRENAQTLVNYGHVLGSLERRDEQLEYYHQAIKLDDRDALIYNNLASAYLIKSDYKKGLEYSREAVLRREKDCSGWAIATFFANYAIALEMNGDSKNAYFALQNAYKNGYKNCDLLVENWNVSKKYCESVVNRVLARYNNKLSGKRKYGKEVKHMFGASQTCKMLFSDEPGGLFGSGNSGIAISNYALHYYYTQNYFTPFYSLYNASFLVDGKKVSMTMGGNIYKIEVGKDATVMAALLTELQSELQKGIR